MMIDLIILMILLIAVLSWREVQILIDRKSWESEDYKKLFWYVDQNSKEKVLWVYKKNLDSFHISNGIALVLILDMIDLPRYEFDLFWIIDWCSQIYVIGYWIALMQLRNLFMHKIYKQ